MDYIPGGNTKNLIFRTFYDLTTSPLQFVVRKSTVFAYEIDCILILLIVELVFYSVLLLFGNYHDLTSQFYCKHLI